MTQNYEIKNRWTGEVLFSCEIPDGMESGMIARHAVETAIAEGANLWGANLRGADLRDANLRYANLWAADLRGANLWGAKIRGADLRGANLGGANLRYANLWGADLRGANLGDADLRGADLRGANLGGAKNAPLIIPTLRWFVCINGFGYMRIGCQNHKVEQWKAFTDQEISRMDSDALQFWNQYKVMLLAACEAHVHSTDGDE
ncbi:MAG TPA: pentapeptide repeat-containing protein [Acinetobacter ursingii]|uniref:Pentapeptide repeat-containing protein n=1 Tax=Acinetobacter ursingii TaxID=108980 RepID=A0A3D2SMS8_9GAMM|nr:pentapeptide repeat-containing protein [Acinetobacter ursingii]